MTRRPILTAAATIDEVIQYPDGCYCVGMYYPPDAVSPQRLLMRIADDCPPPQPAQYSAYDTEYLIWYCDYAPQQHRGRPPQRRAEIKRWECTVTTRDDRPRRVVLSSTDTAVWYDTLAALTTEAAYGT